MKERTQRGRGRMAIVVWLLFVCATAFHSWGQVDSGSLSEQDLKIRKRYEEILRDNPFQEAAFDRVYESFFSHEGLAAWEARLNQRVEADGGVNDRLLLGRLLERQFKLDEAVDAVTAGLQGVEESDPEAEAFMGELCLRAGRHDDAVMHLTKAVNGLQDPDGKARACRLLGGIHLRQGERDKAIETWRRLVESDPEDVFALLELAEVYEANQFWDESVEVFERIAELSKNDPYRRCRSLRSAGVAHLKGERPLKAIAAFEKALGLVASRNWLHTDLKRRLVGVYRDMGELEALLRYADARLGSANDETDFCLLRAETLEELGRPILAEREYETILERSPRSAMVHERLIALREKRDDANGVLAGYERLVEIFPGDADYVRRFGEYHLWKGRPEAARELWREYAGGKARFDPGKLAEISGWYEGRDQISDAIGALEKALALENQNREWLLRLVDLKLAAGNPADGRELLMNSVSNDSTTDEIAEVAAILAMNDFVPDALSLNRRVLAAEPENHEVRHRLAALLMRANRSEEALPHFETLAKQSESEFLKRRGERGRLSVFKAMGQLEEKRTEWEAAVARNPESVDAITRLLTLYERIGERTKALGLFQRRADLRPENPLYQAELAKAFSRRRRPWDAIDIYLRLVKSDEVRSRSHLSELVGLYQRTGEREKAIEAARGIVALVPNDAEARNELAELLEEFGEVDAALAAYSEAARLDPDEPRYYEAAGVLLQRLGRPYEAMPIFRKMFSTARSSEIRRQAVRHLTKIAKEKGLLDSLLDEFAGRVRATPKKLDVYDDLATLNAAAGTVFRGLEILEDALLNVQDTDAVLLRLIEYCHAATQHEKALQYYREWVSRRGEPGPAEYERIGQIQARLGNRKEAEASWEAMVKLSPDKQQAVIRAADLHQRAGYIEPAIALRQQAVATDPGNGRLRYELAKTLGAAGNNKAAVDELLKLLESVEGEAGGASGRIPLGARSSVSAYSFLRSVEATLKTRSSGVLVRSGGQWTFTSGSSRKKGVAWSGKVDSRRALVRDVVELIRENGDADEAVEVWRKLIEADPDDVRLKRDLIDLFEAFAMPIAAAEAGLEYLKSVPDDNEAGIRTALFLASQNRHKDAIRVLLDQANPSAEFGTLAAASLVAVMLKDGQRGRADTTADWTLKHFANPKEQTTRILAGLFMNQKEFPPARRLYERLRDRGEGWWPHYAEFQLAEISSQEQKTGEAIERYSRIVRGELRSGRRSASSSQALYVPGQVSRSSSPYALGVPSQVSRFGDAYRARSMHRLSELVPEIHRSRIFLDLEKSWERYSQTKDPDEREFLWDSVKLAVAHHLRENRNMEALALLGRMEESGRKGVDLLNLQLFAMQKEFQFGGMRKAIEVFGKRNPRRRKEVEAALKGLEHLERSPQPPKKSDSVVKSSQSVFGPMPFISNKHVKLDAIRKIGETRKTHARSMLDSYLKKEGRDSRALLLAAEYAKEDGRVQDAVRYITEAWMKRTSVKEKDRVSQSIVWKRSRKRTTIPVERLVLIMHGIFRDARKPAELVVMIERKALESPSERSLADAAQIHALNGDHAKSAAAFRRLVDKFSDSETAMSDLKKILFVGVRN